MTFSLLSLTVVFACALAWSGFDLSRKALVERIAPTPLLLLLTMGQTPAFVAWAAWDGGGAAAGYWLPALGSVALNVVANLAFIHAFQVSPISVTIPLLSLTPVLTTLAAVPMLGEVPGVRQWAGILMVVAGAFVVTLRSGEGWSAGAMARAFAREPGARLMLVVAAAWALTPPLDKLALAHASTPFHAAVLCGGVALVLAAVLAVQGRLGEVRQVGRAPGIYAVALVVSCLALALQLAAYRLVWVALVETLKRGIGNVLALVYGRFLFGEAVGPAQVAAVVMMGVGVGLILA